MCQDAGAPRRETHTQRAARDAAGEERRVASLCLQKLGLEEWGEQIDEREAGSESIEGLRPRLGGQLDDLSKEGGGEWVSERVECKG